MNADLRRQPFHSHTETATCRPEECTGHPQWEQIRAARDASSARPAEAIVGAWGGADTDVLTSLAAGGRADYPGYRGPTETANPAEAELADLRRALRNLYVELLRRREEWARSNIHGAAARAVAYQYAAGRLQRIIEGSETRHG